MGNEKFSEAAYLAANPDVADAVRRGDFASGWEHYQSHGRFEGRSLGRIEPTPEMVAAARGVLAPRLDQLTLEDVELDQLILDIYKAMEEARQSK